MIAIRSIIFTLIFALWAGVSAILFFPFFLISTKACLLVARPWALVGLWLARVVCGIRYEVRGREHIANTPVIYASKHQSAWDTLIFLALLDRPAYVLKRSLLFLPLWGMYLWRMQMVAIDRSGSTATMKKIIKDSKARLAEERSIVIFPEGTRKAIDAPNDYQPGIIAMYKMLKVNVVPVALNSGCYWGKDAWIKTPGTIIIEFLPAIAPGQAKESFQQTLEQSIENATNTLIKEAKS